MHFQNLQVDITTLPQLQEVALKPIEPNYLKVLRLTWLISFCILLIGLAALIYFVDDLQTLLWIGVSAGGYVVLAIFTVTIGTGSFHRKGYAIREKDVLYRTGWIVHKFHVVPFNRVQHCMVRSGPIERKYGLAGITVYTAAGDSKDITIRGLRQDEAERLKEFIMQHVQPLQA